MEIEDASEVRKLLTYREDTAGGIMTTEFSTIPLGLTAAEALEFLRRSPAAQEDEAMYYVYVVDEAATLRGVMVLRDLVLATPNTPVQEIMEDRPIAVDPHTPQHEVAHITAKYNLLAVPVIDANHVLHGIVTVDDAIDAIIPTAWKKRLPRHY
jgi:magnesium transporter